MSASTTSTKTSLKIKLERSDPDLGPDLKCRIYLNDQLVDSIALTNGILTKITRMNYLKATHDTKPDFTIVTENHLHHINKSSLLREHYRDFTASLKAKGKTDALRVPQAVPYLHYDIDVRNGDNYLDIEHYDRDVANTETDAENTIIRTSKVLIKDIKIHGVKFHATASHGQNKFFPARENEPGKNLPDHIKASPEIGINGKLRLHFKWPLYLHGLYYQEITKTY